MFVFLLATIAAVSAQTVYDSTYQFGNLQAPIDRAVVFDCGSNPDRAFKNWNFVFDRTDLELPGTFTIIDFDVDVTKQVVGPLYGRVEAWRGFVLLGGLISPTIQVPCLPIDPLYGVGTCEYGDICQILADGKPFDALTNSTVCYEDSVLLSIPQDKCGCDGLAPKHYGIKDWNKLIDLSGLESGILTFLASGDYEIRATATDANGDEQACIGVRVPVTEFVDPNDTSGGWLFGRKKRSN
ncbi:Hypp8825 [Branchiostoma lanceolatum]|uniref:Hypp8825 protein n=1 Tax=Branchiostoma lanceolatum TaxID=7740 RepID=A0A8K0EG12_BRALA|nr:Hypp8825 [Branchiostoma lanceolatum]